MLLGRRIGEVTKIDKKSGVYLAVSILLLNIVKDNSSNVSVPAGVSSESF